MTKKEFEFKRAICDMVELHLSGGCTPIEMPESVFEKLLFGVMYDECVDFIQEQFKAYENSK